MTVVAHSYIFFIWSFLLWIQFNEKQLLCALMLERVDTECINEETSWITKVPSVTSIITFLNYTLLRGCKIFFQAILCFMGGNYIYIHEITYKFGGLSSLYHPRVKKNRFLTLRIFKCAIIQYHCSPEITEIMKLVSFYLGSYFQVWDLSFIKRLQDLTSR